MVLSDSVAADMQFPSDGAVESRQSRLQHALAEASRLQLAAHPGWLALLHYKTETISRRIVSQADDDAFFLSADGKWDAAAELSADLRAFYQPGPKSRDHAQCLFPARWHWLKQQIGLSDEDDFPCYHLQVFLEGYQTDHLTLVFPAMYLNNPGSTFGHTFLRFDGEKGSVLFSQTLNYAAKIDKTDSLPTYIAKGLSGGYPGIFKTRKYYETVQEYSNLENRDIWEYRLNLSEAEIRQLVRHVWEVKGLDFDYYFFRENCAFRLLALIDAVRPELNLTTGNQFPLYAIPVDTVRALDSAGLIIKRDFRPSLASQLQQFYQQEEVGLSHQVTLLADQDIDLASIMQSSLSPGDKAIVLNQAYVLLQFRGMAEQPLAEAILSARSQLHVIQQMHADEDTAEAEKSDIDITARGQKPVLSADQASMTAPEKGHQSRRLAVGFGRQLNQSYLDFRFRPAFHDLVDAASGYVTGADINVLDTRLKYFLDEDELRLESLRFFNITSLSPVVSWYRPVSWFMDIRIDRSSLLTQSSTLSSVQTFLLRGGGGYSVKWHSLTPFLLATTEWNLARQYEKGYSLFVGAQLGTLLATDFGQGLVQLQRDEAVSGFEQDKTTLLAQWQFNLDTNTAVRLGFKEIHYRDYSDKDWFINMNLYF